MKATISTFTAFGQRISFDLRIEVEGAGPGQTNYLAVSRDISLDLVRKNGPYELSWREVGEVAFGLLFDLHTLCVKHQHYEVSELLVKYLGDMASMQKTAEYDFEYGSYAIGLLASLNKKTVVLKP